jgi:hypothetical protein
MALGCAGVGPAGPAAARAASTGIAAAGIASARRGATAARAAGVRRASIAATATATTAGARSEPDRGCRTRHNKQTEEFVDIHVQKLTTCFGTSTRQSHSHRGDLPRRVLFRPSFSAFDDIFPRSIHRTRARYTS